uniref:Gelsolin-like domain-containing protein n=1 Tax=Solanum lycopersicum TaxID=4081 RepID=A0A494GA17_SOLLC
MMKTMLLILLAFSGYLELLVITTKQFKSMLYASSLNTYECFLLQSSSLVFIWHGKQSTHEQQNLAAKIVEFLKPRATVKHTKEGTESSAFWLSIGEKQDYTSNKLAP